jgi:PAS domain S-box-containing protein
MRSNNSIAGVEGILLKSIEPKQLEGKLAIQQNSQLEKLVEARTISLQKANERLETEIKERRLAEMKLNEKTILLDNILRNADEMAIATTDLDFRITYYNPIAEHLFGHNVKTVVGKTVQEIHIQENVSAERFAQAIETVHKTGEYRYFLEQKQDDGVRHIESRVAGIYSPQGQLTGYSLFSRDITQRKQQEDKLNAFNTKLQNMVEEQVVEIKNREQQLSIAYGELNQIFNMAEPLCLISNECRFRRVNQAFCDYFQVSEEEIVGQTGFSFWGCDQFTTQGCFLNQFQKGKGVCQRYLNKTIRKKQCFCSIRSVPHYNNAGELIGIVSSFFDMTDFKKAQDALLESQKQLRHAEKLSAIGTLSGSIAHEFNNPLCGVTNVLNRLERKTPDEDIDKSLIQMAQTECERMKKLILDLQSFNRPSNNQKSDFDLHKSIDDLLYFFRNELHENKVKVIKNYSLKMIAINGVKDQIKQVLLNLIKNSLDAMGTEGGVITISTEQNDLHFNISISDSGIGINPSHMEHLFEPFFTTKPEVKGTGLGLSVAHGIIKGHNGTMDVTSVQGQGTTFIITLPSKSNSPPTQVQIS